MTAEEIDALSYDINAVLQKHDVFSAHWQTMLFSFRKQDGKHRSGISFLRTTEPLSKDPNP